VGFLPIRTVGGHSIMEKELTEHWQCKTCLHVFPIEPSYAVTLIEHGCAWCGSHEFVLYDLLRELAVC